MRFVIAVVWASLLPCTLYAQQAWGDDGGCARVVGKPAGTDLVFILWPDRIERWESSCQITAFGGDIDIRGVIHTNCSGEGEDWTQSYGITPTGDDTFAIWPVESPDTITELRRCQ